MQNNNQPEQENYLTEGISLLCKNDSDIEKLITPCLEEIITLLEKYLAEIEKHNPVLSLVGTNQRKELILKHILDSLAPLGIILRKCNYRQFLIARQFSIADIGSGAGLPGIPLAITLPEAKVTLIERKGRRAGFLRNTIKELGLTNIFVEEEEMEKVKTSRFNLVTCRAFKPLEPKIFGKMLRLCAEDGILSAYKGRRCKIEEEMAALEQTLQGKNTFKLAERWEVIPCPVPLLDEERHFLLVYK